jgi:ABC-type glutathione transport system ATPase component
LNIIDFLAELDRHFVIGIVGDLGDGKTITMNYIRMPIPEKV